MKKCLGICFLVVLTISTASAQISVKLTGGMSYVSPSDYNDGIQGRNDYIAALASVSPKGTFGKLHLGWNADGEVIWNISERFAVGIGAGYFRIATDSQVEYQYPTTGPTLLFGGTTEINAVIRAVPIVLNLHYALPIAEKVIFTAGIGGGLYCCTVDYLYDFVGGYMGKQDWSETQTFTANKNTVGFQGAIGISIPVANKIYAELNVSGRLAKISDLQGGWTDVFNSPQGSLNEEGRDAYFTVWDYKPSNGKTYRFMTFDNNLRTNQPNFRKGDIDLSGVSVTVGIRVVL